MKAIKDLLQRIRTDRENRQGTWIGIDESHIILNALEKSERIETENTELRARLEKAVELPLVQTIRGNKLPYEVAYKDDNGRIIVTKYRRWQKKQAEARLKELQGEEG